MRKVFLTAEWRKLAIVNYAVDPGILTPYLPYGTELDYWNNNCYVSLVGFRFINTRLRGLYVPFHINFEEINLRFYVRYKDNNEWKRGVTFIKEIVPRPVLTLVANKVYNEKYITLPTKHHWKINTDTIDVGYQWKFMQEWNHLEINASSALIDMKERSEEEFITEHYWGYTKVNDRITSQYQVEHPRWQTYPVLNHSIHVRFGELYGAEFASLKDRLPDSVMLAEGSTITVRAANKITQALR